MTLTEELASWAATMSVDDVSDRVVAYARSQVLSQLAAARAALDHPLGDKIVAAFGVPTQQDPRRAAMVLASLTMALDYDDTVYVGHVTHSSVNVSLAYSAPLELDGRSLVAAVIAAGECAARVTASATLGPHRGQTAAHAHLVGAPAARRHAQQAPSQMWVDAWGLVVRLTSSRTLRAFSPVSPPSRCPRPRWRVGSPTATSVRRCWRILSVGTWWVGCVWTTTTT